MTPDQVWPLAAQALQVLVPFRALVTIGLGAIAYWLLPRAWRRAGLVAISLGVVLLGYGRPASSQRSTPTRSCLRRRGAPSASCSPPPSSRPWPTTSASQPSSTSASARRACMASTPLGGFRHRPLRNVMLTMIACGLWHSVSVFGAAVVSAVLDGILTY